ncbi:accessory gene regulator B family protein [Clostridium luticellarii]|jgi:accessory gene regulator B|uniref:Putative AgrB-like protein n=1 Tax=Clostridium luticellarii TaxID=1691940 RepID=A0A2T0BML4_9CLOT|nr:accessory gene regulator B family protein [Clostridium luticellarii]MCI1945232.1 accessory gene regulator B family protein [Clostridium luticellarii]MCI1969646.1 accessory gene regulator B family protein [Clostridium luticellarii]MCI1994565.1 accessory gene regulator B family protein [Clostridium luticellarii]MCI2038938.1 accessory gene regulator B family protein [Clostridium luticellarii]PRR85117.1 putative AgrB-like protein [Clostridium luticellarii]
MNNFITCLVKKISESNPEFSELELKKMEYGLVCTFDEITKLIPYFIIFWIFSLQNYYIIALLFFCPIRLFSGGYHAKTYWGCFFISFIVFYIIVTAGKYIILNNISVTFLLGISFTLICIFSPVDNINKKIKSEHRRKQLKYYSILTTISLIIICYFIPNQFLSTAVISISTATLMMLIGKLI